MCKEILISSLKEIFTSIRRGTSQPQQRRGGFFRRLFFGPPPEPRALALVHFSEPEEVFEEKIKKISEEKKPQKTKYDINKQTLNNNDINLVNEELIPDLEKNTRENYELKNKPRKDQDIVQKELNLPIQPVDRGGRSLVVRRDDVGALQSPPKKKISDLIQFFEQKKQPCFQIKNNKNVGRICIDPQYEAFINSKMVEMSIISKNLKSHYHLGLINWVNLADKGLDAELKYIRGK